MKSKTTITRKELASKLTDSADRKMAERELFMMRSVEDPSRSDVYSELIDWLELDIRYHRLAAAYYSDDSESIDDGFNEDLLLLIRSSDVSPKLYAQYLREISPDSRDEEKITHAAVKGLKRAMLDTLERQSR